MGAVFKPGLYAITAQRYPDVRQLVDEASLALEGGAAMLQFRDKSKEAVWRREAAAELCSLCAGFGAPFIVNDDARLAVDVGARGVHVGSEDIETAQARRMVGSNALHR